jgi:hypothetical protein
LFKTLQAQGLPSAHSVSALYGTMGNDSNFAGLAAMEHAGMQHKVVAFPT